MTPLQLSQLTNHQEVVKIAFLVYFDIFSAKILDKCHLNPILRPHLEFSHQIKTNLLDPNMKVGKHFSETLLRINSESMEKVNFGAK